jgi:hypothetical protein
METNKKEENDCKTEAERLLADKKCDMTFEDFVRKHSRMCPRPGYYAGRGPLTCDLDSNELERLWEGLKTEVGDEAARNFVMMVEELEDMSATAFLWSFMRFWPTKRWSNQKADRRDGVTVSGYGDDAFMEAEVCVMNVLSDRRDPEAQKQTSRNIKERFLMQYDVRPVNEPIVYDYGFDRYGRDDFEHPYAKRRKY